ncbi:hypothetical protein [Paraburkholderia caballeronis]|uniref:Lipoprotein n=1 Tax=Paraburkholderia caballeronis TaxID=416943 RepID=A0A1H7H688_9BURK|nr:hypothetical protein [Paraburkholderia caballeronis]PXW29663.1 hypothetical protein C7403_101519 [Paraburkholderia caballeronis]PXX04922.1 hypothetical protein C7407_101519 [Paraburkholderia caballeronis]RAK05983.1 hypothetical protein C7409_101519 [Paraburkholderia caballeronis]SEB45551.1 hypothetical protein SAMN05445871_0197 [Paraburkholderia caballeronis]SEK44802.1 hypothetical protein SAMN05192542_102117 [Paraburkholderia caballeronis]
MKRTLLTLLCVLAAGCATRGQVNPDVMQIATAPLTCSNADQCAAWWQRAQQWVRSHSTYELQTATDTLIQTSGPGGGKRALAYQITKTPNNDGTATIGFAAHCDSSLGCKPNPWEAGAAFKQFVRTGVDHSPAADTGDDAAPATAGAASGAQTGSAR